MNKLMIPRPALVLRVLENPFLRSSLTSCASKTCGLLLIMLLGLIQVFAPAAANAQKARLVFSTSFIDPNSVNNSNGFQQPSGIGGLSGTAIRDTVAGKATYSWTMPSTIGSEGAPCTLGVRVKTKEETLGATMEAMISCMGEVDEKNNKTPEVNVFAGYKEDKEATGTFTLVPRGYSEDRFYLELVVRLHGGMDIRFRYNIEQTASRGSGSLEYNTDRPGQDYRNFDLPEAQPELCQAHCGAEPQCQAFTYVQPGVQGASARCWLKSGVPDARASSCCISGVKNPS